MIQAATFWPVEYARTHAQVMQDDDEDGWTYVVEVVNPISGLARIAVCDADGFLVGYL